MAALPMIRKTQDELELIPDIEYARLAAYIDGEGCIRIRRQKRHVSDLGYSYDLELSVVNTDLRLLEWLRKLFGGSVFIVTKNQYQPRRKECFRWYARSSTAEYVITRCLSYFLVKPDQASTALGFQQIKKHRRTHLLLKTVPGVIEKREVNDYAQELCHRVITRQKDYSTNSVQ